jgi:hypothetical protein
MREPGYYWVKSDLGNWKIGEYYTDKDGNQIWLFIYNSIVFEDEDFIEIDERRIERIESDPNNVSETGYIGE